MDVRVKRIYELAAASDGYRVLIDRLWPRGVTHERAQVDEWVRDLGPSTELRTLALADTTALGSIARAADALAAARRPPTTSSCACR